MAGKLSIKRMPYLFVGERIVSVRRQHPIVLLGQLLLPLVAITIAVAFPSTATGLILAAILFRFLWYLALWYNDLYILTNVRLISLSGIITKKVTSVSLSKMTDARYSRTIPGRILGYGLLDLETAGQKDLDKIDFLPDPDNFYRAAMSLALGKFDEKALQDLPAAEQL